MYREILRLYQEDKKISYHYHSSPYIMIKKFVPHPFWSFRRVVAKACSLGLIPNTTVKEIQELLEHKLKTIIADIAKNIMDTNIDIWKHRCKILYGNWQAIT